MPEDEVLDPHCDCYYVFDRKSALLGKNGWAARLSDRAFGFGTRYMSRFGLPVPLAGQEAVAEASRGEQGARREPARRAFVAALLMAFEAREDALKVLVAALEEARGPLSQTLCAGLARITGEPLSFTRKEWLVWWGAQSSRPGASQEPGQGSPPEKQPPGGEGDP